MMSYEFARSFSSLKFVQWLLIRCCFYYCNFIVRFMLWISESVQFSKENLFTPEVGYFSDVKVLNLKAQSRAWVSLFPRLGYKYNIVEPSTEWIKYEFFPGPHFFARYAGYVFAAMLLQTFTFRKTQHSVTEDVTCFVPHVRAFLNDLASVPSCINVYH